MELELNKSVRTIQGVELLNTKHFICIAVKINYNKLHISDKANELGSSSFFPNATSYCKTIT